MKNVIRTDFPSRLCRAEHSRKIPLSSRQLVSGVKPVNIHISVEEANHPKNIVHHGCGLLLLANCSDRAGTNKNKKQGIIH